MGAFGRLWELIQLGGWLMWPILLCSVISVAVVIERFVSFRRARIETRAFLDRVLRLVNESRNSEAVDLCRLTPGPVSKVLEVGILLIGHTKATISDALEEAAALEMARLERRIALLGTIYQLSPLLGLLGTVVGMIEVFQRIESSQGNYTASDLAGGIWTALITTAAGLTVAIPTLAAHNYFMRQTDHFATGMEMAGKELLDCIEERGPVSSYGSRRDEEEED